MSKPIVTPRLKGLSLEDHKTLVASFQTIKPAIDAAVSDATGGMVSAAQLFALQQQIKALEAKIAGLGTVKSVGLSMPAYFNVSGSPVTASGVLTAAQPAVKNADGTIDVDQVQGKTSASGSGDYGVWSNNSAAPTIRGMKSRGVSVGSQGAVLQGDSLLDILGEGSDGLALFRAGRISITARDDFGGGIAPGLIAEYVTDESGDEKLATQVFWSEASGPFAERARLYLSGTDIDPSTSKAASIFGTGGAFGMATAFIFFGSDAIIVSGSNADIDLLLSSKGNGAVIPSLLAMPEIATPTAPAATFLQLYPKSDDNLYTQTSAGLERQLAYVGDDDSLLLASFLN